MALGMKGWFGIVGGGFALVAVGTLPPSRIELPVETRLPEQVRYEALWTEARRANRALQAWRWSDSLSAFALRQSEGGLAVGWHPSERLTHEGVEAWKDGYEAELGRLEPRDPSMVVGIFWQPRLHGMEPDVPEYGQAKPVVFVGTREGAPYCLLVLPYGSNRSTDEQLLALAKWTGLGGCTTFAAHGMPGERVLQWLESGAIGFGKRTTEGWDQLRLGVASNIDVPLFGQRRHPLFGSDLEVPGCLAGRPASCVAAVTDPQLIAPTDPDEADLVALTPVSYVEENPIDLQPPFGYLDDDLLSDLVDDFGSEAFARFWKSEEEVPTAFEAAFGVGMGDWLASWVDEGIGRYRAGPGVRGGDLLLSVLAMALFAAAATGAAMRRHV